jgi:hypothetical protein
MIRYLITAIGFPPGGSGRYTCTKFGKREHKRETIHKTVQKQYRNTEYTIENTKIKNKKHKRI